MAAAYQSKPLVVGYKYTILKGLLAGEVVTVVDNTIIRKEDDPVNQRKVTVAGPDGQILHILPRLLSKRPVEETTTDSRKATMASTALAAAPQRATTSITLAFGLLNIPLAVYTGTEETRVARREFLNGDSNIPVGRSPIRKDTGEVVSNDDVVRMAEADNGVWVALSDEEIASITSPKGLAEVISFVKNKDTAQYLVKNVVQVRPKATKGKVDAAANRAFILLLTAMKQRKVCALVKVAMRGPARYALLDAQGNLFQIYMADEIREARDLMGNPIGNDFSEQELALATTLIDTVGITAPVVTDDTAPVVQAYVNDKAAGVDPPTPPAIPAIPADIMSDLLASIEAAGKRKKAS